MRQLNRGVGKVLGVRTVGVRGYGCLLFYKALTL